MALFFLTEEGQRAYHSAPGENVPLLKSLANEDFWRFPISSKGWSEKNFDAFVSYPDASTPVSVISRAPAEIADILNGDKLLVAFGKISNGNFDTFSQFVNIIQPILRFLIDLKGFFNQKIYSLISKILCRTTKIRSRSLTI